ncbi:uncharacterized protein LOC119725546 [Patiria miniata]|uniref:Uncharacterized protein n=1 Tax=Patiria miniata TaxID=46514 RepID=A0A913ZMC8_PATMI|nr:uncharacterized protein LOC119725546 [Patiria miniata]
MDKTRDPAQVREAILKVFKAMTSSPCGGPAILVGRKTPTISKTGGVKTATETFHKYKLYDSDDDVMISDGTCTPEKQKPKKDNKKRKEAAKALEEETRKDCHQLRTASHKTNYQKEKRRKSRAERNRRTHQKQQQVDPHERTEFRKHIKRAREISSRSRIDNALQDSQPFSVITQSRLTRPVGIYNKGKKSDKVYRAPIHVPDRVKKDVAKGLKEILGSSSPTSLHCAPSYDSLLFDRGGTPAFSTEKRSCHAPSVTSATRSRSSFANEDLVSETATKELPKDPPYVEIATNLMASLDVRTIFPDRDYFKEVQEDLLKLMKQNRVSEGCDRGRPTSHVSGIDALLARNKGQNQKSRTHQLIDDTPPHEVSETYIPQSHHESGPHPESNQGPHPVPRLAPRPGLNPEPHPGNAVYSLTHGHQEGGAQPRSCHRPHPEPHPVPHPEPHPGDAVYSLSQESEGLDLRHLMHQQEAMSTNFASSMTSMPDHHKRALHTITDGMELLRRAEEIRKSMKGTAEERLADEIAGSQQHWDNGQRRVYHLVEHSTRDILDQINTSHRPLSSQPHPQDSVFQFGHSDPQDQIHGSSYLHDDRSYHIPTHRFHDDYSLMAQSNDPLADELFIQEELRSQDVRPENVQSWRKRNGQLQRGTDSDNNSPIWYPTYMSPLQKPRMESPSPPKLYPQRMY